MKEWRDFHIKESSRAGIVIGWLRQTLSTTILHHLKSSFDLDSQTQSVHELNRIFEIVQHHYGSYNHHRAQRSLQALEEFPVFTNATSITTTL
jgi:hypothetical protein